MTEYTSSTGTVRDFTLDLDRILKMEEESPGFSLMNDFRKFSSTYRLTYADRLCRAMGTTYKQFIEDGFYLEDLIRIVTRAMGDLHFFRVSPTESEDATPEPS